MQKKAEIDNKAVAYDQIKWERDVAISQLNIIGKGLGEKMDDIISLIEKNTPRVLTLDEVMLLHDDENYRFTGLSWIEHKWRKDIVYAACDFCPQYGDSFHLTRWFGVDRYVEKEDYGKTWRVWNVLPTDAQRVATPWEQ